MRILYLINAPGQRPTGAGRRTLSLAAHEISRGEDVTVAAPPGSGIHESCAERGIRSLEVRMDGWPGSMRKLRGLVRDLDPDIVHAMSFLPLALAGLTRRSRPSRPKVFASILVDPASPHPMATRRFRGVIWRVRNAVMRRRAANVDAVFAVSAQIASHLDELGIGGRIVLARASIDIARLRERAAAPIELPEGSPRIGTGAVRLVPAKGVQHLLKAFVAVLKRHPDAVCLIAGERDPEIDLERIAKKLGVQDRVHFLGFLEDPAPFVRSLDLYVTPSLSEGISSASIEAMALGRPIAATRVGGIPEVVIDGVTGLLVEPGDPDALACAMNRLLDDSELAHRLSLDGLDRAMQEFDISHFFEVTDAEYERPPEATSAALLPAGDLRPGGTSDE
ncbi:MAG: glycosyltransferase family 4 protein [Coriobacteriales bacterium]|nr:glycosyltransferase family 4 protein [Coriobacteriales bacterium]